jgi:hypothetical protein
MGMHLSNASEFSLNWSFGISLGVAFCNLDGAINRIYECNDRFRCKYIAPYTRLDRRACSSSGETATTKCWADISASAVSDMIDKSEAAR